MTHMIQKGSIYYYRKKVPKRISSLLPYPHTNKREIIFSLKTTEYHVAVKLEAEADKFVEAMFDRARIQAGVSTVNPADFTARLQSMFGQAQPPAPLPSTPFQHLQVAPPLTRGHTIKDAYDLYLTSNNIKQKTKDGWDASWRIFLDLTGLAWTDDISLLTKDKVLEFKKKGTKLPTYPNSKDFRNLTASQQITKNEKLCKPTITNKTWNQHLNAISTVMKTAMKNGLIDVDPTSGMSLPENDTPKVKRLSYDANDLKRIFQHQKFQLDKSVWREHQWVPILAMFHGCRVEELCQMMVADIRKGINGIWFMALTETDDEGNIIKSIKNEASIRSVPLHKAVIDAGFLKYVERIRASGADRLFPHLKPIKERYSHSFSRWWSDHKVQLIGSDNRLKVFHSFRHTFKDACRNAGITEEIHDRLTGHTNGSVGRDYGQGHDLPILKETLDRVAYEGISL